MKARDLFNRIVSDIEAANILPGYKFRKRDSRFIFKTEWGQFFVELDHYSFYGESVCIRPVYEVRYDILHKWTEIFSKLSKIDHRDRSTFFSEINFAYKKSFEFIQDCTNYQEDCTSLINTLKTVMEYTQQAYATMEKAFEKEILPILQGKAELPNIAAEWAFHYLAMCLLCAPERYKEFKAMVLKRLEELNNRNEPNVIKYYADLDKILAYLETPGTLKL